MKKTIVLLLMVLSFSTYAQKNLAKVYKINGIDVYILNEPLRSYEVVYDKGTGLNFGSYLTGGLFNKSVSGKVTKFVKGVLKKAKKENKQIDAIIYSGGKNVVAVKYTDEPTKDTDGIARVQRVNGIPMYAMCEPLKDFRTVATKGGGIKWKSAVTGGVLNNSIEEDLAKFAKKFKKYYNKGKIDALLYTGGKSCDGIKFKD